jgi:thioredoxin 1
MYDNVTRNVSGTVIVKCGATWCRPCTAAQPEYIAIAKKYPNVTFYNIDVEDVEDFQDAAMCKSIPSFFIFKGGLPAGMIIGANMQNVETEVAKL